MECTRLARNWPPLDEDDGDGSGGGGGDEKEVEGLLLVIAEAEYPGSSGSHVRAGSWWSPGAASSNQLGTRRTATARSPSSSSWWCRRRPACLHNT